MQHEQRVYPIKVDASGRILLPAEVRKRYHIASGDTVILVDDGRELRIKLHRKLPPKRKRALPNS